MGVGNMFDGVKNFLSGRHEDYEDEYLDEYDEPAEELTNHRYRSVSHAPAQQSKAYRMIVVEPYTFADSEKIADHLKSYRPVVINLEKTEEEVGRRLIDFVSGVTYALEGHIEQVSQAIFLAVPNNMTVDTENYTYTTGSAGLNLDDPWKGHM